MTVTCAGVGSPEYVLTAARFGRWADLLAEPTPFTWGLKGGYNAAAYHYARATALLALGRDAAADIAAAEVRGPPRSVHAPRGRERPRTLSTLGHGGSM